MPPVISFLRLEGGGVFALSVTAYVLYGGSGWLWLLVLLPDLSFLAYSLGPKIGAAVYNAAHTYLIPLILALLGLITGLPVFHDIALIWSAHIGADRLLGYGLKQPSGFGDTHLGQRGKLAPQGASR